MYGNPGIGILAGCQLGIGGDERFDNIDCAGSEQGRMVWPQALRTGGDAP